MKNVLIVGGGIAGVSLGAALCSDCNVTLLEREPHLAHHASGRSAALFESNYGKRSAVSLARASADFFHNSGYLTSRGLLMVAQDRDLAAFLKTQGELNLPRVSTAEAGAMFPLLNTDKIAHAAYHDAAWDIDTDLMIQDYARIIRTNGGQIVTSAEATQIRHDTQWHVTAGSKHYRADILVNAAGSWVDEIANLAHVHPIGITPLRRSMARVPVPEGIDLARSPMVLGAGETWYCKPDAGALIISPADEDPQDPHDAWADDMVLAEGIARYDDHMSSPVTRVVASWAGLRSFAPDRELVIGFAPDSPSFFWCAGQGGYGFQTAPASAQLGADLILARASNLPDDLIQFLSPRRLL